MLRREGYLFSGNLPSICLSQAQDTHSKKDRPLELRWQLLQQSFSFHHGS